MDDFNLLPNDQLPTQVNISDVSSTELDYVAQGQKQATGAAQSGWWNRLWAAFWASIMSGISYVISMYIETVDQLFAQVFKLLKVAQGEKNSSFYDLAAAVVEDLTGAKVDAAALKQSSFGSGRLAGMQTLGGDLYKILAAEFAPTNAAGIGPDTGPAERFLGFLMNWSIRQGNIEAALETLPESWRVGEGAREYGELMAKQLGLGRLARRALQPLIQTLVADPLLWQLRAQYRPTRLAKEAAIKKFFRDSQFETQMRTELSQEGFSDDRINDLISDARPLLEDRQIVDLLFRFNQDAASVKLALTQRGWGADESQQLIDLQRPLLERGEIAHLWARGTISKDDALGYLGKLGYDAATADLVLQAHVASTVHVPVIHFGELRRLLQENVIDVLEFQDRLTAQGYNTDDVQLLTLDALNGAKGKQKILGLAEIKAGFKAGIILGPAAIADLEKLGYSKDDAALIVATFPTGKKAGSTPPTSTTG